MEHLLITKNNTQQQKDYSHVPCKFFKMGNCQAGPSCPFSHSPDIINSANNLPCKYFAKGNCKFGNKCVNAHILPNGSRMNSKGPIEIAPSSNNNYFSHTRSASFSTYMSPPMSANTDISHSASSTNYFTPQYPLSPPQKGLDALHSDFFSPPLLLRHTSTTITATPTATLVLTPPCRHHRPIFGKNKAKPRYQTLA